MKNEIRVPGLLMCPGSSEVNEILSQMSVSSSVCLFVSGVLNVGARGQKGYMETHEPLQIIYKIFVVYIYLWFYGVICIVHHIFKRLLMTTKAKGDGTLGCNSVQ